VIDYENQDYENQLKEYLPLEQVAVSNKTKVGSILWIGEAHSLVSNQAILEITSVSYLLCYK